MAVTLLAASQRVARSLGLDPTFTAFSNDDETNDLVQYINEAYEELLLKLNDYSPYLNKAGSFNTSAGTRTYSLASDALSPEVYSWSFENETNDDASLQMATKEYLKGIDPLFDETQSTPAYIYLDGEDTLAVYPVPDGAYTIKYEYAEVPSRLSATTDTFLIPDRWVRFIERKAEEKYLRSKGLGDPDVVRVDADDLLSDIFLDAWKMDPAYFIDEGF